MENKVIVIGGGAAGFFSAIVCAEANSSKKVLILEKNRQLLSKVRISGGGRCNVTHACFDPAALIKNYPRGHLALRGPFSRFQPRDTIQWFENRGVELKVESDGRMFPITDSSETIIHCLKSAAQDADVEIQVESGIETILKKENGFEVTLSRGDVLDCQNIVIASGSSPKIWQCLEQLGHQIVPPVPSLFTFNIPDSPLVELAGVSVPLAHVKILETDLEQTGPLLITHWGFSGPAILKLSAWGARILHQRDYRATLSINWLAELKLEELKELLTRFKEKNPAKQVSTESPLSLSKNLWKKFVNLAGIPLDLRWSYLSKNQMQALLDKLHKDTYQIQGKSTNKDEFVTCGGVHLDEVNFKTMESKKCPGLYFAGEVLDVDGVTGGFNFQNAWTTGWIAGNAIASL
jgi:hypothetical protein